MSDVVDVDVKGDVVEDAASVEGAAQQPLHFWKPHRYDLFDDAGRLAASVYRTTNDNWCWFLTAQNVAGEKGSMTDAMGAVERALKVSPSISVSQPGAPATEAEVQQRANRFLNETVQAATAAGAIGLTLAVSLIAPEGKESTLSFSKFPPFVGADDDAVRANAQTFDNSVSKLIRESMDKAAEEAVLFSAQVRERSAATAAAAAAGEETSA